jgi:hypothetical protein
MKNPIFTASVSLLASTARMKPTPSRMGAMNRILAITVAAGVIQSSTLAQNQPPPPPCQEEIYHAFDFWIGEWDVFGLNGQMAGDNKISVQEKGCMLLEEWTSIQGGTGQSYNFYDPGMKKWRQIWVSGGAIIDYAGGLNQDGAMVLEGEISYRNGTTAPFKGTWTSQKDGSIRQHFEQYNTETKEWSDWFVGIYKKKAK